MENHSEIVSFLWGTADLIRDSFKRGKYQDVILPFTVLRRIDSVLAPTKDDVVDAYEQYQDELDNLDPLLQKKSGYAFYNTSKFTFRELADSKPDELRQNFETYIGAFSDNMEDVLRKFDFRNTLDKLERADLLHSVAKQVASVDLHPDTISNEEMGVIFEELIRKFNEALDENPGEHFTPREVVQLMTELVLSPDRTELEQSGKVFTVYDPCCGTGGMLTTARDRINGINEDTEVYLFGQEVNPETYAICKSDLYLKTEEGKDAERIAFGSTLSDDAHRGTHFDYQLANPPYGKDWRRDKKAVKDEAKRGTRGRFAAGTPRISDGQLLFLQHMVDHLKPEAESGGRASIIMNGSPLFTGDAGSGESNIRRWLLEEDYVEAIIALPEQLFYNTGIATYVWVVSNAKAPERAGKVQLIDASGEAFWTPMRKSLGDKRREIADEQIGTITRLFQAFDEETTVTYTTEEGEEKIVEPVKIYPTEHFGYRKIRVERPLRLNLTPSEERIERLWDQKDFQKLAESNRQDPDARATAIEEGPRIQREIIDMLQDMPDEVHTNYAAFRAHLKQELEAHGLSVNKPVRTVILDALSEKDPDAEPVRDTKGRLESDTDLRDYENVPLTEDVFDYFEREVKPHVPDAYIDEDYTDDGDFLGDGDLGRVGYEINFNRYFYEYTPPRALDEIEADLQEVQRDIVDMMEEVTA